MAGPGRFFGPGEVRLALLSLLADEPMHGYELMKRLEERSGGIYRASAGTIYPTLQQLEDEGHIVSDSVDGKRVYKLTEAGRRELAERDEAVRQIWRRARRWEIGAAPWTLTPPRSEARPNGWSRLRSVPSRASRRRSESSGCVKFCCARFATSRNSVEEVRTNYVPARWSGCVFPELISGN